MKVPLADQIACAERLTYDVPNGVCDKDLHAILATLRWLSANEEHIRAFVALKNGFPEAEVRVREAGP